MIALRSYVGSRPDRYSGTWFEQSPFTNAMFFDVVAASRYPAHCIAVPERGSQYCLAVCIPIQGCAPLSVDWTRYTTL